MKKYIKYALCFLALGIVCGIFYREFTKGLNLVNVYTPLGLAHTHFLVLGVAFILLIGLICERLENYNEKLFKWSFLLYIVGTAGAGTMLVVRGIIDVLTKSNKVSFTLSSSANGAISGISGLFHALLGVGIILIFVSWLMKQKQEEKDEIAHK